MRSFVTSTFVLALALAPAAVFAQATTPPAQPPAGQQPAAAAQPAAPAAPKLSFTTPAGMLLVQVKPDQTATFEEMIGKVKAGGQSGWKVYKAAEPAQGGNVMYVVVI